MEKYMKEMKVCLGSTQFSHAPLQFWNSPEVKIKLFFLTISIVLVSVLYNCCGNGGSQG